VGNTSSKSATVVMMGCVAGVEKGTCYWISLDKELLKKGARFRKSEVT